MYPLTTFLFFVAAIALSLVSLNPVVVAIVFVSSSILAVCVGGLKKTAKDFLFYIPIIIVIMIMNPVFSHRGKTVLFFLNSRPYTLEASIYGLISALMLVSVLFWCKSFSKIFTADKTSFLFGRVAPKLSVLLTAVFAMIPKMKKRFRETDNARRGLGLYSDTGIYEKIKSKLVLFGVVFARMMESSIETGDSMRAKGYGLEKRTSYGKYAFKACDGLFIVIFGLFAIAAFVLLLLLPSYVYYPTLGRIEMSAWDITAYILIAISTLSASALEIEEKIKWHCLKSKI